MSLYVITGTYRIKGASPDGDSVRFYPDDPTVWTKTGIKAKPNAHGGVQLRLDAIDALETHYTPPNSPHAWRQPVEFGDGAAAALLDLLGFSDVVRDGKGTVTSSTPAQRTGYILSRFADVYGRAVALAYAGECNIETSDNLTAYIDVERMRGSANYELLADGWVYPTFYSKLYVDFREALAEAARKARHDHKRLWARDSTCDGFRVSSVLELTDQLVILPKLFRRLAEYVTDADGDVSLTHFKAFLSNHDDDRLYTIPRGQTTGLDSLLQINDQTIKLMEPPEDIVFMEN